MKVILFNGSPKKNGCTYTALSEIAKELNEKHTSKKSHSGEKDNEKRD